jgi:hypothetical protein
VHKLIDEANVQSISLVGDLFVLFYTPLRKLDLSLKIHPKMPSVECDAQTASNVEKKHHPATTIA